MEDVDVYQCAILGITGPVGQKLSTYFSKHPYFELTGIVASERSAGKKFRDAIAGNEFFQKLDCKPPSEDILEMRVEDIKDFDPKEYDLIFSALDPETARLYEEKFADHTPVFTAASANRYADSVPVHNISVNDDHLELIGQQQRKFNRGGFICAKSNCTTSPIVSVLKKIISQYGIEYVSVYTEQALSGAGKGGLDENSSYRKMLKKYGKYPYIEGENSKVVRESKEILGALVKENNEIIRRPAGFAIDAFCTRVNRENVHDEHVLVLTEKDFKLEEITRKILEPVPLLVPSLPRDSIVQWKGEVAPEKHVELFGTMRTAIGEIKKPKENNLQFRVTTDNTGIGAGEGLVASAELYVQTKS